jgi:WD40-like Beta Propeller Repeat
MKSFSLVAAAVVLVGTLIAGVGTASAAPSGPLRIAYSGDGSTAWGVCTMNPDGTNNVCVSDGYRPVAAPGGDFIWFSDLKDHDTGNYRAIYKTRADGSDTTMVVFNPFSFGPVSVDASRDGTRIVYDRYDGNSLYAIGKVYVANADGSGERLLTPDGGAYPTFSPDGQTVLYFGCTTAPINNYGNVCTVPTAGGASKAIIFNAEDPRWNANGKITYKDLASGHIFIANGDGSGKVDTGIAGAQPSLSPDGKQLAFVRYPPLSNVYRVWVANVDGSNQRELTVGENPVWFNGAAPATQPAPTVANVQPSSGTIVGGQPVTFTWSAAGSVASQSIVLEDRIPTLLNSTRDEPFNPDRLSHGFTVVSNLPGDVRSYTWTPPASTQWTDRIVRVAVSDTQGQVADATAGPVTTRPAPQIPPYVRVAYPSEPTDITWYGGSTNGWVSYVIRDPDGLGGIDVRLSTDGGATFPILLATDGGSGTVYTFTVPDVSTTQAIVKIIATDVFGNTGSDVSDNPFTIIGSAPLPTGIPSLSIFALQPAVVDGGQSVQAYVQLSGDAPAGGAAVSLASDSAAATVPATLTIPAGSQSAVALVTTETTSSTTTATITATYNGVSIASRLTINAATTPPPASSDSVSVTRADYTSSKQELRLEATSTSSTATLKAYVTSTNALLGTLTRNSGGKYFAKFNVATNPQSVTVRSSAGGSATRTVTLK